MEPQDDPATVKHSLCLTCECCWTVNEAYVDAGFGGHNWEKELGDALLTAYSATDASKAYGAVETMLNKLGDPFTRIVTAP